MGVEYRHFLVAADSTCGAANGGAGGNRPTTNRVRRRIRCGFQRHMLFLASAAERHNR